MALKRKKPKIRKRAKTTREPVDKPPFSVPSMDEVRAVKPNGLKVGTTPGTVQQYKGDKRNWVM